MLENSDVLQLNHGLMEVGYVDHQTILSNEPLDHEQSLSISMTATMDNVGNLVLGKISLTSGLFFLTRVLIQSLHGDNCFGW